MQELGRQHKPYGMGASHLQLLCALKEQSRKLGLFLNSLEESPQSVDLGNDIEGIYYLCQETLHFFLTEKSQVLSSASLCFYFYEVKFKS